MRVLGWKYVHVAIDANSRVVSAEMLPDERAPTTSAFLVRAVSWYATLGERVTAVLTDNRGMYRSALWAQTIRQLRLTKTWPRPSTPRTNGQAGRVRRTWLAAWARRMGSPHTAYAQPDHTSHRWTERLARHLHQYTHDRAHAALNYLPSLLPLARALCTTRPSAASGRHAADLPAHSRTRALAHSRTARCAVRGARSEVRGPRCAVRGARSEVRGPRCGGGGRFVRQIAELRGTAYHVAA
ncbi:MAG: DDE-type integrase/transposase/recombinase [Gemmatimonadota bacterium]